jgi:hypothetical protein
VDVTIGEVTRTVTLQPGEASVTVNFDGVLDSSAHSGVMQNVVVTLSDFAGGNFEDHAEVGGTFQVTPLPIQVAMIIEVEDGLEADNGTVPAVITLSVAPSAEGKLIITLPDGSTMEVPLIIGHGTYEVDIPHGNDEDVYLDASTITVSVSLEGGGYVLPVADASDTANIGDTFDTTNIKLTAEFDPDTGKVTIKAELENLDGFETKVDNGGISFFVYLNDGLGSIEIKDGETVGTITVDADKVIELHEAGELTVSVDLSATEAGNHNYENLSGTPSTTTVSFMPEISFIGSTNVVYEAHLPIGTAYGVDDGHSITTTLEYDVKLNYATLEYFLIGDSKFRVGADETTLFKVVVDGGGNETLEVFGDIIVANGKIIGGEYSEGKLLLTYELTDPYTGLLHTPKTNSNGEDADDIAVVSLGFDVGVQTSFDSIKVSDTTVRIADDAPVLDVENNAFVNGSGVYIEGKLADIGADKDGARIEFNKDTISFGTHEGKPLVWAYDGQPVEIAYGKNFDGTDDKSKLLGKVGDAVVFELTGIEDGTYTYEQHYALDVMQVVDFVVTRSVLAGGGNENFYSIMPNGTIISSPNPASGHTLLIYARNSNGSVATVNGNNNSLGIAGGGKIGIGNQLYIDPVGQATMVSVTLTGNNGALGGDAGIRAVYRSLSTNQIVDLPTSMEPHPTLAHTFVVQSPPGYYIDYVIVTGRDSDTGVVSFDGNVIREVIDLPLGDLKVEFNAIDGDGDSAFATLTLSPSASEATTSSSGDEEGAGVMATSAMIDDLLTDGSDPEFKIYELDAELLSVLDASSESVLNIETFNVAQKGGDVLKVDDLLDGLKGLTGQDSVKDMFGQGYLNLKVVDDGNGQATLTLGVDKDGRDADAFQMQKLISIHLDGVQFTGADNLEKQLIQQLIDNSQIKF